MQTDDKHEMIDRCLEALPTELDIGEVVSLLCTIAAGYSPKGEDQTSIAPAQGIIFLELALRMMKEMRETELEKSSHTLQ